jgi:cobalt-zinc-cadmium resistance protein CzcA
LIFFLLYVATGAARIALLVMTAIPLALPGAILGLLLTHTHFSISAGVGLIALAGVSVQNGVILVSLVSALQKSGLSLREAVVKSAIVRMQPAIMTTCVAVAEAFCNCDCMRLDSCYFSCADDPASTL